MRRDRLGLEVLWGISSLLALCEVACAVALLLEGKMKTGKLRLLVISCIFAALVGISTALFLVHVSREWSARREITRETEKRSLAIGKEQTTVKNAGESQNEIADEETLEAAEAPEEIQETAGNSQAENEDHGTSTETVLSSQYVSFEHSLDAETGGDTSNESVGAQTRERQQNTQITETEIEQDTLGNRAIVPAYSREATHVFSFDHRDYCQATNLPRALNTKRVVIVEVPAAGKRQFEELMNFFKARQSKRFWEKADSGPSHEFKFSRPESNWYLVNKVVDIKGAETKTNTKIYLSLTSSEALKRDMFLSTERKFEDATSISVVFPEQKAPFVRITSCENQRGEILTKIYNDYFLRGDPRGHEFFKRYAILLSSCTTAHHLSTGLWETSMFSRGCLETRFGIPENYRPRAYNKQVEKNPESFASPITQLLPLSMCFDIVNNPQMFRGIITYWKRIKPSHMENRAAEIKLLNRFLEKKEKFLLTIPECYNMPTAGFIKFLLSTMSSPIELPEFFVEGPKLEDVMTMDKDYLFACFDKENGKIFADALEKKQNKQGTCLYLLFLLFSGRSYELVQLLDKDMDNVWITALLISAADRGDLPGQRSLTPSRCWGVINCYRARMAVERKISEFLHTYRAQAREDHDIQGGERQEGVPILGSETMLWGRENGTFPSGLAETLSNLSYGQELLNLLDYVNLKMIADDNGISGAEEIIQRLASRAVESIASNPIWSQGCIEKEVAHDFTLVSGNKAVMFQDAEEKPSSKLSQQMLEGPKAGTAAAIRS